LRATPSPRSIPPAGHADQRSKRERHPLFNLTRYFNGDMAGQRFLNSVTINQGLDPAMFDPNSGYNPNKVPSKPAGKH
jgi:hypothetical protein